MSCVIYLTYSSQNWLLSAHYPDFLVKISEGEICIVETKGREDLDVVLKIERLKQWCDDVNNRQSKVRYSMLFVKQDEYEKYNPQSFNDLISVFK